MSTRRLVGDRPLSEIKLIAGNRAHIVSDSVSKRPWASKWDKHRGRDLFLLRVVPSQCEALVCSNTHWLHNGPPVELWGIFRFSVRARTRNGTATEAASERGTQYGRACSLRVDDVEVGELRKLGDDAGDAGDAGDTGDGTR